MCDLTIFISYFLKKLLKTKLKETTRNKKYFSLK